MCIRDSPWPSLKFYGNECTGTSGNNGWHIRHYVFNYQIGIEYTADRAPQFSEFKTNGAAKSDQDIHVRVRIEDDNPEGGSAGVSSATVHYSSDGWSSEMTVSMMMESGTSNDGRWVADIPGISAGNVMDYYVEAVDVNNNSNTSWTYSIHILSLIHI